jgi:hypothetical protein
LARFVFNGNLYTKLHKLNIAKRSKDPWSRKINNTVDFLFFPIIWFWDLVAPTSSTKKDARDEE